MIIIGPLSLDGAIVILTLFFFTWPNLSVVQKIRNRRLHGHRQAADARALILKGVIVPLKLLNLRRKLTGFKMAVSLEPFA